ncbi:MAG: hypothetical protein IKD69_03045 [Solobacterium sp.]|nr:hypothetical protein [Solobacterium sp.]
MSTKKRSKVYSLALIAMMTAVLEVAKFTLNSIANVELVTLLVVLFTLHFTWKLALPCVLLFATLECMWWGFGTWSIVYYYMWPLLVGLTEVFRKKDDFFFVFLCTMFGLLFGAFCSLLTLVIGGPAAAVAWWVAGIPYDIVHGVSNFVIALVLLKPLRKALERIVR